MVTARQVAEQHEDWLNLTAPEPPWLAVPAAKRAFPNGLNKVRPEIRAQHKQRWQGDAHQAGARTSGNRTGYVEWLLRDVLGWGDDYLTADRLAPDLARGVTRHDVTVKPTGAYCPRSGSLVGLFEKLAEPDVKSSPRVLVFVLATGTDPTTRPAKDPWPATWVQRAALVCRDKGVPLALVTDGDYLTLVHAADKTPTGWGTWRAAEFATEPILLDSFVSMLDAVRLTGVAAADTLEALFAESVASQAEVTNTLGGQVRRAAELLVNAISRANLDRGGTLLAGIEPHEVYEAAVTVLMRTVFLLVAEETPDLLPVDNEHYRALYSIRTLREELQEEFFRDPEGLETRSTAWHRLLATSRAVHAGIYHHDLVVPAYGGTLFDPDRFPFLEGRTKDQRWRSDAGTPIPVTDLDVLAILDALLVLRFRSAAGVTDTRRLSYREVGVEQVGHIYERLLDHDAVLADQTILGLRGRAGDEPEVRLSALEARRIDGHQALLDFLTDDKAKKGGFYVGTRKGVAKLLGDAVDSRLRTSLLAACAGDQTLARRIEPFANLLRLDLRDRPMVFLPGAYYVTETGSRRDSGTAYTTKELAEDLVEHALAPLCYSLGPQDTADTNQWKIRPSAEILGLKVCDPAVGSGAILVAACRYLADRLVEAWRAEGDPRAASLATAADDPNHLDVVVEAKRLVAEQCCYGVDRNPMAVEMAKLSMWLTTLAKDRPFTFLNHAIKYGDSLLGIWSFDQLRWLHFDPAEGLQRYALSGLGEEEAWKQLDPLIDQALVLLAEMRSLGTISTADVERKEDLYRRSERLLVPLLATANLLTGVALAAGMRANPSAAFKELLAAEAGSLEALIRAVGTADETEPVAVVQGKARRLLDAGKPDEAPSRNPLHWPLAFPEVFSEGRTGFDAMVGNPPFTGGQKITGVAGIDFRNYLVAWIAESTKGSADLVAYFFLHAARVAGSFGYLATNTIGQGDTSEVGLARLIGRGWTVHHAISSMKWPGDASLEIAKVWLTSRPWTGPRWLDERTVAGIDEMLYAASRSGWRKQRLAGNAEQSFIGSYVLGMGFTMSPEGARMLIEKDPRNGEVLFPYLGGEDLNESPTLTAPRWVINFSDWTEEQARSYPDCFQIVEQEVKSERQRRNSQGEYVLRRPLPQRWWHYAEKRPKLYRCIDNLSRVMALSRVSKTLQPVFVPTGQVLSEQTVVFVYEDNFHFGVLSSGFHWRWATRFSSSMRTDVRYTPSDVFETFPQPRFSRAIDLAGKELDAHRSGMMIRANEGLTKTYNRLHDPDDRRPSIARLRELHVKLDYAVRDAYGWSSLDLEHGHYDVRGQGVRFTFSPVVADEILDRLLELNRDRYMAEVAAGLHSRRRRSRRPLGGLFEGLEEE